MQNSIVFRNKREIDSIKLQKSGSELVLYYYSSSLYPTNSFIIGSITVTGSTLRSVSPAGGVGGSTNNSIFLGLDAGSSATGANYSNFLGYFAGQYATNAYYSNFLGVSAGNSATDAYQSNFIGADAGNSATNANNSNFLGSSAGSSATNANNSNFLGASAGFEATDTYNSNFIGQSAGYQAASANNSNFLGKNAGFIATNANNSNFLGQSAGSEATNANYSNFIGGGAGQDATNANFSNFLGASAGNLATNAVYSNFIGASAGSEATYAEFSNFIGQNAGQDAISANNSNFLGRAAGTLATSASYSNFIGLSAGFIATYASHSVLVGFRAGANYDYILNDFTYTNGIGANNIIIGTNITLDVDRKDSINLGAIIFATGSYSDITTNPYSGSVMGKVGINKVIPLYNLDVSGSGNFTNGLTVTGSINGSITGSLQGTSSWANNATTASYVLNAVSASYSLSASNAQTASYVLNAISSSFTTKAVTASYADNFTVAGTLTATTIVVQTITSSQDYVTGSTRFGSLLSNTHQFTGSVNITGSLNVTGSVSTNAGFYVSNNSMNFGPNGANSLSLGSSAGALSLSGTVLSLGSGTTTRTNLYGNIGIGTTTPFSGSSVTSSLELGTFNGANADGNFIVRGYSSLGGISKSGYGAVGSNYYLNTSNALLAKNTDSVSLIEFSAGAFLFKNASSTTVNNPISLTERMRIAATGNVGIGTSSPSFLLDVSGSGRYTNGLTVTGSLSTTDSITANNSCSILLTQSLVSPLANTVLQLVGPDANPTRFSVDTYNNSNNFGSSVRMRRARGTAGIPLAISSSDVIAQFVGDGYTGTSFATNNINLSFFATENWNSTTNQGTYAAIRATPTGTTSSIDLFKVFGTGTTTTGSVIITGSQTLTGSLVATLAITSSTTLISGSGTNRLIVIGSGSAQPLFTVQGSQGELFSITDILSGSLFSVNDISGLPILETFSDSTTLMGSYLAPSLNTTNKITTTNSGSFTVYSVPSSSYDGMFIEYTAKSGSDARAGRFMAIWSGSSVNYTDNPTTDFGNTTKLTFTGSISGSNMVVTGNVTTGSGWTVKSIIRSI